jgi:hypothetical protein
MPSPSTLTSTLLNPVRSTVLVIATLAILVLGALGVESWRAARAAAKQLAATVATQKNLLDQASARETQRDAAVAKTVATINRAKAAVKTPAQAAAQIPQILRELPVPLMLNLPAPDAANPNPAATATIPAADLQPIYNAIQDCRACEDKLAAAEADLADERTKESALITERNAAISAAKGNTFRSKLKSSAKWLLLGAALGATAAATIHHKSP